MPGPHYPHSVPDPNQAAYNIAHPTGNDVSELPDLTTLDANVQSWLTAAASTVTSARSAIQITQPGKVLIVCDGETGLNNLSFYDRCKVLNGKVTNSTFHGPNQTWKSNNQNWVAVRPKVQALGLDAKKYCYLPSADDPLAFSQGRTGGGRLEAFTDIKAGVIYINAHVNKGSILVHEYIHTFDPGGENGPGQLGWGMDEGIVDFFARDIAATHSYKYRGNGAYEHGYKVAKRIVDTVGLHVLCYFWFVRDAACLQHLAPICVQMSNYLKPGEEDKLAQYWSTLQPLINNFCAECQRLFAAKIEAPTGKKCAICGMLHGLMPSLFHHWHKCSTCGAIYCPTHGAELKGKKTMDRTRNCDICGGRTTIV